MNRIKQHHIVTLFKAFSYFNSSHLNVILLFVDRNISRHHKYFTSSSIFHNLISNILHIIKYAVINACLILLVKRKVIHCTVECIKSFFNILQIVLKLLHLRNCYCITRIKFHNIFQW